MHTYPRRCLFLTVAQVDARRREGAFRALDQVDVYDSLSEERREMTESALCGNM